MLWQKSLAHPRLIGRVYRFHKLIRGGFKFQVQRVHEGAGAHRLPAAWQSSDNDVGGCSADGQWRSTRAGCSPTDRVLDQVAFPVAGHRAVATSARRSAIGVMWGCGPVDPFLAPEADAPCAPDAVAPAVRSATCRVAAHTGPHRWSRPRAVSACRQDTRVGATREIVGASSPEPNGSSHTATARGPRVCVAAALTRPTSRQRLRRAGPIGAATRGVAGRLAAQGAGRPSQHRRHRQERLAVGQAQTQGLTYLGTQVSVGSGLHGDTVAHSGVECCAWN